MEQSRLWGTNRLYGTKSFDGELTDYGTTFYGELTDCMEQSLLWGTNRLYGTKPFDGKLTDCMEQSHLMGN